MIKGVSAFQEETWNKLRVVQSKNKDESKDDTKADEEESKSISFDITGPCKRQAYYFFFDQLHDSDYGDIEGNIISIKG